MVKILGKEMRLPFGAKAETEQKIPFFVTLAEEGEYTAAITDYSVYENQARAYTEFVWVYAAVKLISESGAMASFGVYKHADEKFEEVVNHPFEILLRSPNPYMSRFELWEQTFVHLELQGNAFWYLQKTKEGLPAGIWIMRPDRVTPIPDRKTFISSYKYKINNRVTLLEPSEVVHFKRYHPLNDYQGLSAVQVATRALALEKNAMEYNAAFFANNAMPDGVLVADQFLTKEQMKVLEDMWKRQHKGPKEAHKMAILSGGLKPHPLGVPPKDAEFINSLKLNRDQIMSIYGVPASKVGIVEDVNRANAEANDYTFMKDVMTPKLIRISEKITSGILVPYYGEEFVGKFEDMIPERKELVLKEIDSIMKSSLMTINELRMRYFNLPAVDWGNVPPKVISGEKSMEDILRECLSEYEYKMEEE